MIQSHKSDKPGLARFTIVRPARGYAYLTASRATISSFYRPVHDFNVMARYSLKLVGLWRKRVNKLAELGWPPAVGGDGFKGRKWSMLNCQPATFVSAPTTRYCNATTLCPHCWGRWVADQWRAVDAAFFPPPTIGRPGVLGRPGPRRMAGMTLVHRRVHTRSTPCGDEDWATPLAGLVDRQIDGRRRELARFRTLGVVGGLEMLEVTTYDGPDGNPAGWQLAVRQFLVLPSDRVVAFLASTSVIRDKASLTHWDAPSRGRAAAVLASVCRYPRNFLVGQRFVPVLVAKLRSSRRFSARFGCLYGVKIPSTPR